MREEFEKFIVSQLKEFNPEIEDLAQEAKENNIELEEYLYITGQLDERFLELKKKFFNLPIKKFEKEKIPKDILTTISEDFAKKNKMIVFDKNEKEVYLGVVSPLIDKYEEIINFLKNSLGKDIKIFLISIKDFYVLLKLYREFSEELKNILFQIRETQKPFLEEKIVELGKELLPDEQAPVIKLVQALIEEAVFLQASDIHIEPLSRKTQVRFRILGDLKTITYLPKDLHGQIVNRIKILARLKLDETRIPQDGRIRVLIQGREIDLRISTLPTIEGEKVAIRILDPLVGLKKIEELGMFPYTLEKIEAGLKIPHGLILITGPTGSGKTTTLYSMLRELNKESVNIISLEDPVEYRIERVNQSQIRPEINYTFASGLREILRQDPDIILIGEIRDLETAELAVHASLTGHLVLSTLHTNNALGAIIRLMDIGIERFLIPTTLRLIIAQRLAKKLCDYCKKEIDPPKEIAQIIEEDLKSLNKSIFEKIKIETTKIYHPQGCEKCNYKGFMGRIGIFETILITEELQKAIHEGRDELQLESLLKNQDFVNLRQDGIIKALSGLVTIEEIIKIT